MTLLDEVRGCADDPALLLPAARLGQGLAVESVDDVVRVGERLAVARARLADGRALLAPLTPTPQGWRRCVADDGVSLAVLGAPAPLQVRVRAPLPPLDATAERGLAVDMSNDVRVVDDAVVVKWQLLAEEGSMAGARVAAHLAEAGFDEMPAPLAFVSWGDALVASVHAYLPGAEDGWDWMVRDVVAHLGGGPAPDWPAALGRVVGRMHSRAATPTGSIPHPRGLAPDLAPLAQHFRGLLDAASELDPQLREAIEPWWTRFVRACEAIEGAADVEVQPIHGDLHAGQVLRWDGGLAIGDFDGNPLLEPAHRGDPGPTAYDVAALLRTLDHVAVVAARRAELAPQGARAWARAAQSTLLTAYLGEPATPPLHQGLLEAFMSLSPLHEAVYAHAYLPRWSYVPLAVLQGW